MEAETGGAGSWRQWETPSSTGDPLRDPEGCSQRTLGPQTPQGAAINGNHMFSAGEKAKSEQGILLTH